MFGQLGVGPGNLVAWSGGGDSPRDGCCDGCPTDAAADFADFADFAFMADPVPSEEPAPQPCEPGCDDCICCPSVALTRLMVLAPRHHEPPDADLCEAYPGKPAAGVPAQIFRPPRPSLV